MSASSAAKRAAAPAERSGPGIHPQRCRGSLPTESIASGKRGGIFAAHRKLIRDSNTWRVERSGSCDLPDAIPIVTTYKFASLF